jgi:hypothetical protein
MEKDKLLELKENTRRLLSVKALRFWDKIIWDGEEMGNSSIGFYSLDPETKPETLASFINERAERLS